MNVLEATLAKILLSGKLGWFSENHARVVKYCCLHSIFSWKDAEDETGIPRKEIRELIHDLSRHGVEVIPIADAMPGLNQLVELAEAMEIQSVVAEGVPNG